MKITMYRPDTEEQTRGLIAETVRDLLKDLRLSEWLVEKYSRPPSEQREDESDTAFAVREFRHLLPTDDATDVLRMRSRYGWTYKEIAFLVSTLNEAVIHFNREAKERITKGFAETLRRDAGKLEQLRDRWEELLTS